MAGFQDIHDSFKNKQLIEQALTHRSWVNEHPGLRSSNERLEFLGDAILEFVVSDKLYIMFPDKEEGYLTALRSNLVNTQSLASLARKLSLGNQLYLSKGEDDGGGRENTSLLADTFEAVLGALFLDQGLDRVRDFIENELLSEIPTLISQPLKDAKSRLQEYAQSQGFLTPKYRVVSETGPSHAKEFVIQVSVNDKEVARGTGKSKSEAEQNAATKALDEKLQN